MKKNYKKIKIISVIGVLFLFFLLFLYNQKQRSESLRIGFVTDWEYSHVNSTKEKRGALATEILNKAVAHYNYFLKPDLVVAGGDYIGNNEETQEETFLKLEEIKTVFDRIKADKLFVLGKKDYQLNSLEKTKMVLGLQNTYYSKTIKGIKIIVLDTTQNDKTESAQGTVDQNQLEWLASELEETTPVVIFSHHSPIETPVDDIWRKNLTNQEELQNLLKNNNDKIIAVVSGNNQNDYIVKKSGIPFLNIGGLTNELTLGRFSDIKVTPDEERLGLFFIDLKNNGLNGSTYEIKRDLNITTATRIVLKEKQNNLASLKWENLKDLNNPEGIINDGLAGEPNISTTRNGVVVVAFENKEEKGKIQVKFYENGSWSNLEDTNYSDGLISLGKGSNPNIATKGEDVFVVFTETDHNDRTRLLKWTNQEKKWEELSPRGFISDKASHEPTLIFDRNEENLYVAYAEKIRPGIKQTQAKIKKWDGKSWETLTESLLIFADKRSSSVDEFDLAVDSNNFLYIAYEEIDFQDQHSVKVKKWDGEKWNNLIIDNLYFNQITKINGFSPSITIDNKNNLYISLVEDNEGLVRIFKYNQTNWEEVTPTEQTGKSIEPFIEIDNDNNLYLAYSEYKNNVVIAKSDEPDLVKTSAWRVRVKKLINGKWLDCQDSLNYNGYVSKGSGKGDPALKIFENNLYLVFSDEASDYAAKVMGYKID